MVHPENGVFDVVLVQASPEHAMLAEGPVPLSGRPIYTVYLQVGGPKEWMLQYCVPQSAAYEVKSGGAVVQLGNPVPVKAPFPRVTVLPPLVQRRSRLVLHGFLTEQGSLRGLNAIVPDQQQRAAELIPYLQQWEFRPATRDGRSVEIEIVLIVPDAA
jgi:hypothetical protein